MSPEVIEETIPPRNRPELSDVIGTTVLAIIGLAAMVAGFGYGMTVENGQVGPGFLPVVTGGFVLLASLAEIARLFLARTGTTDGRIMRTVGNIEATAAESVGLHANASEESAETSGLDTFGRTEKQRNRAPFHIFLTFGVALALVPVTGLIIALSLAVLYVLVVIEKRIWWVSALITLGAAAFVYTVFVLVLSIPLPTGILGLI
ncbi:tripartite tricarboxylate transporter TctB family protein [Brevibacterium sp.]|uniref:tripartite tricarboxylate transporter TctB family protein n=1 Tax=Brevibacterium sp. TaxID=1701 RepID=UPI0028111693|nr:tripartite tricarboxylate transporter TctB family protein [Brevibacterium sp.]